MSSHCSHIESAPIHCRTESGKMRNSCMLNSSRSTAAHPHRQPLHSPSANKERSYVVQSTHSKGLNMNAEAQGGLVINHNEIGRRVFPIAVVGVLCSAPRCQ